jgi:hypothetical protein
MNGHIALRTGLVDYAAPAPNGLFWSLINPFIGDSAETPSTIKGAGSK